MVCGAALAYLRSSLPGFVVGGVVATQNLSSINSVVCPLKRQLNRFEDLNCSLSLLIVIGSS